MKDSSDEKNAAGRSIHKYLAIATMAASLGVSLGVPVVDALADGPGSPPAYGKVQSDQTKIKNSKQFKESSQYKESTQFKEKQKIKTGTNQNKVNK
ncbi:MAG: hypothetical protein ACYDHW_13990 [Syntrophorhabdaceae bacterium]